MDSLMVDEMVRGSRANSKQAQLLDNEMRQLRSTSKAIFVQQLEPPTKGSGESFPSFHGKLQPHSSVVFQKIILASLGLSEPLKISVNAILQLVSADFDNVPKPVIEGVFLSATPGGTLRDLF